jgi:glutamate synthase domain-containing protein 3
MQLPIGNADRAVGARIAGELAKRRHGRALPIASLRLDYRGSAGQSFGAFCVEGMQLVLEGEANDYVGKGLSGGEIVIRPFAGRAGDVVAGNTVLYGATGGRAFLAGRVGERFAVRNSGALAVAEGAGDHACEYMTAGAAVILGPTGHNVGAGMSGGVAYLLDAEEALPGRCNTELVTLDAELSAREQAWLRDVVERHHELTGSAVAQRLLADWDRTLGQFRRVVPHGLASGAVALPEVRPVAAGERRASGAS